MRELGKQDKEIEKFVAERIAPKKDKINYLIRITETNHPSNAEQPEPEEIKLSFLDKVKNYFKNLFKKKEKDVIETLSEKINRLAKERDVAILDVLIEENKRYYQELNRIRKESGGVTLDRRTPLFYNPEICDIHNEHSFNKNNPTVDELKKIEKEKTEAYLNFHSKGLLRVQPIIKNSKLINLLKKSE